MLHFISTGPTTLPTSSPSSLPTDYPSLAPSTLPTAPPSNAPSTQPTQKPTFLPSTSPTMDPTQSPTVTPSRSPSLAPSTQPSNTPSTSPTTFPTQAPVILYPVVRVVSSSSTQSTITVNVRTSRVGVLYCGAFASSVLLTTGVTVKSSSYPVYTDTTSFIGNVTLTGMEALKTYAIFCYA